MDLIWTQMQAETLIFWKASLENDMCVRLIKWNLCNGWMFALSKQQGRSPWQENHSALCLKKLKICCLEKEKDILKQQLSSFFQFTGSKSFLQCLTVKVHSYSLKFTGQCSLWFKLYFMSSIKNIVNKQEKQRLNSSSHVLLCHVYWLIHQSSHKIS